MRREGPRGAPRGDRQGMGLTQFLGRLNAALQRYMEQVERYDSELFYARLDEVVLVQDFATYLLEGGGECGVPATE